jgi:L-lysine 2,3-aminomutase
VIQKYRGRALLVTGSCAINCRYCFRRHFDYAEKPPRAAAGAKRWRDRGRSGHRRSDPVRRRPVVVVHRQLTELTDALAGIDHLKRLRIHSRLPVVLPERVDTALADWLRGLPWPVAFVLHANHANEFDADVDAALARLPVACSC